MGQAEGGVLTGAEDERAGGGAAVGGEWDGAGQRQHVGAPAHHHAARHGGEQRLDQAVLGAGGYSTATSTWPAVHSSARMSARGAFAPSVCGSPPPSPVASASRTTSVPVAVVQVVSSTIVSST